MRHVFCHIENTSFCARTNTNPSQMCFPYNLHCPHNDHSLHFRPSKVQRQHPNPCSSSLIEIEHFHFPQKTIAAKVDLENKDKVTEWEHRFSNLPSPSRINQICNLCIAMMIEWWCYGEVYLSLWTTLQISWHLPTLGRTAGYHQLPHQQHYTQHRHHYIT